MLKVFQFNLTNAQVDAVNESGWEGVDFGSEYLRKGIGKVASPERYKLVAEVDTDDKEEAFYYMNMWRNPEQVKLTGERYVSMSVGDLIVDEDDQIWVCSTVGFQPVPEEFSL